MSAPVVRIPSPRRPLGEPGPTGSTGSSRGPAAIPAPRSATPAAAVPQPRRPLPQRRDDRGPATAQPATAQPATAESATVRPAAGRHRAVPGVRGRAVSPTARAFVAVARAGSLTTLAAMLVLAAAVAGLADGTAPTGQAAEIASTTLP